MKMDSDPLLSPKSPFLKNHTIYSSSPSTSSPLCPLPEHQEITIPPVAPSSSSSPSSPDHADSSWLLSKPNLHRSRTAPAISVILSAFSPSSSTSSSALSRPSIVRTSVLLLFLYLTLGVAIYTFFSNNFSALPTHPVIDALYFCIVTMCTIGYGEITPATPFAKLFSIMFVLFGFGFIDILLSSMVTYVLDLQESLLLASIGKGRKSRTNYLVDVKKGRMRIRMKVGLALAVVFLCIGAGTAMLRFVEKMDWLDSFNNATRPEWNPDNMCGKRGIVRLPIISLKILYHVLPSSLQIFLLFFPQILSSHFFINLITDHHFVSPTFEKMSATHLANGYGDRAFKTMTGRLFASIWLLISTLAVARAFFVPGRG